MEEEPKGEERRDRTRHRILSESMVWLGVVNPILTIEQRCKLLGVRDDFRIERSYVLHDENRFIHSAGLRGERSTLSRM